MPSDRLLVSLKRFIGDAVMTAPLIELLETRFESLDFIASVPVAQTLWHPERTRRHIPLDPGRKPWEVLKTAMSLRKHKFGVAVVVNHSFRAALTVRMAGIPVRVGHATEGRNSLLTHTVPYDESRFEAYSVIDLAGPLGFEVQPTRPTLAISEGEREAGRLAASGATIGMQPGARFAAKQLPIETLTAVARALQAKGHTIALLGGEEESDAGERFISQVPEGVVNLIGKTDIRGSLGALANLQAMVGADTGLMHMATAVGCASVTVFGPTPADKWGHFYGRNQVLRAPDDDMSKVDAADIERAVLQALAPLA